MLRVETAYDTDGRAYLYTSYNAATGGSVINRVVRLAGAIDLHVISHERDDRTRAIPPAPEAIAVAPVGAERGAADQGRPYRRATRRASSAPRTNRSATTTKMMVAAISSVESAARVGFWYCSR